MYTKPPYGEFVEAGLESIAVSVAAALGYLGLPKELVRREPAAIETLQ